MKVRFGILLILTLQNCMDLLIYDQSKPKPGSNSLTSLLVLYGLSSSQSTSTSTDTATATSTATSTSTDTTTSTSTSTSTSTDTGTVYYTISGTIAGLTASGLVLQNNGGDNLTVSDGATSFFFNTPILAGATYAVTIQTQPTGLTCTVSNGTGVSSESISLTLSITCSTATYIIGGTITGLTASGLVLQNNAGNNLTVISGATSFTFNTSIAYNSTYSVTIQTQPTGLTCTVSNGTGTATANVTNVSVTCSTTTYTIGGTITGLTIGSGVVLQNNAGNDLTVLSGASSFTFTTPIAHNSTYSVRVKTHPTGLICNESTATGTATANVSNITIACSTSTRNWGVFTDNNDGTVSLAVTAGTWGGQTYTTQTLTWMKCSHGQTWKASTNDCTGSGSSTTYGATTVQYCNANDNSCDNGVFLNGTGTSGAYTACNSLNAGAGTNGKTNWRVPTKNELKLLIECTDKTTMPTDGSDCGNSNYTSPSINSLFPNAQSFFYWSSTSNTSSIASDIGFSNSFVYSVINKTFDGYVRCVSGP